MVGPWVLDGDQYRCTLHAESFSRLGGCVACEASPDAAALVEEDEPLPTPPPGCCSTHELEAKQIYIGNWATKMAEEVWADSDPEWSGRKDAIKLYDLAIKAYRAAGEYARSRETDHVTAQRMRKLTAMKSRARH